MKKIIFVCHGNIYRSPAAEWAMKNLLIKYGLDEKFVVESRATSLEEIGNDIYPPMKRALYNAGIPFYSHKAKRITQEDYDSADYIFYMDRNNKFYLDRLIKDDKNIIESITKYSDVLYEIDDPWYTGQFDKVLQEITDCCGEIIAKLLLKRK